MEFGATMRDPLVAAVTILVTLAVLASIPVVFTVRSSMGDVAAVYGVVIVAFFPGGAIDVAVWAYGAFAGPGL